MRDDTGLVDAVYRAKHSWVASYAARTQFLPGVGPRVWEETAVAIGLPATALILSNLLGYVAFYPMLISVLASVVAVMSMRRLAEHASTARRLTTGKAITKLVVSGNDELIEAAIDPLIGLDSDPAGAAHLVNELRDAWREAEASNANEKSRIIAALRETAEHFPVTDADVAQVRRELAEMRRSLESLTRAQRELDAVTSTANLADPPTPPASLGLLRAASESIAEDARVVAEVAGEQRARESLRSPD